MTAPKKGTDAKSSPFAALAALRDSLPEGKPAGPPTSAASRAESPAPVNTLFAEKVVVARSKKGRGGKVVTTIAGVRGDARTLEAMAQELRKALGCGATVEDELIIVQGDQAPRVRAFLEARGARRVIVGS